MKKISWNFFIKKKHKLILLFLIISFFFFQQQKQHRSLQNGQTLTWPRKPTQKLKISKPHLKMEFNWLDWWNVSQERTFQDVSKRFDILFFRFLFVWLLVALVCGCSFILLKKLKMTFFSFQHMFVGSKNENSKGRKRRICPWLQYVVLFFILISIFLVSSFFFFFKTFLNHLFF